MYAFILCAAYSASDFWHRSSVERQGYKPNRYHVDRLEYSIWPPRIRLVSYDV